MLKNISIILIVIATLGLVVSFAQKSNEPITGAPPYGVPEEEAPDVNPLSFLHSWTRPEGPAKVGIQVGHWKNNEVPEELKNLRNNTGASGGGMSEWEVNYTIAQLIAQKLRDNGVEVDVLPTTIEPDYWADVFIAIHADGSEDRSKSGYKFASPWRDFTGNAEMLVDLLNSYYGEQVEMEYDPNISRNMRGYYAFAWWRYDHSIHPMTTAAIAETGFLTNAYDRSIIIERPDISANAISDAIIEYLRKKQLLG